MKHSELQEQIRLIRKKGARLIHQAIKDIEEQTKKEIKELTND